MAHNVKIKYYPRENTQMGTHSFYAQPIPNGTYGFEEICKQAHKNTSIETHTIRAAVEEYMKVAMEKLCDGFRVEIGTQFLTCSPSIDAKVKDELNQDGTVKKAVTADDLKAVGAKSRVKAVVNPEFSREFANSVKWQKSDKNGNAIEDDEEDATLTEEETANQGGGSQSPSNGNSNGGGSSSNGSGSSSTGGGSSSTGSITSGDSYSLTISRSGQGTSTVKDADGNVITGIRNFAAGSTIYIEIVPISGHMGVAQLNGRVLSLTNNNGTYTGSFQMPAQGSVLSLNSGSPDGDMD